MARNGSLASGTHRGGKITSRKKRFIYVLLYERNFNDSISSNTVTA
jgi:hypothetical protein